MSNLAVNAGVLILLTSLISCTEAETTRTQLPISEELRTEQAVLVSWELTDFLQSNPVVACLPGPNLETRARQAYDDYINVFRPYVLTVGPINDLAVRGPEFVQQTFDTTKCNIFRLPFIRDQVELSRKIDPRDHILAEEGLSEVLVSVDASCVRLENQTRSDALANASRALDEFIARWDTHTTKYLERIRQDGANAGDPAAHIKEFADIRDDVRAKYKCGRLNPVFGAI